MNLFASFVENFHQISFPESRLRNSWKRHSRSFAKISSEIIQLDLHSGSYVLKRLDFRLAIKSSVKS